MRFTWDWNTIAPTLQRDGNAIAMALQRDRIISNNDLV